MANLATFDITDNDYVNVETAAGISFSSGSSYSIQGLNNDFYIRSGETGKGFYIKSLEKITYNADGENLFIKKLHDGVLTVNIG